MDRDNRGGSNRKQLDEKFFKQWSPQMSYVLGFIYADDTVEDCRVSSRTCYIAFSNNDLDLLIKIRELMSSNHKINRVSSRTINVIGKSYNCKDSYYLRTGSKSMYFDLIKLGLCPRKSLIIELPEVPKKYFQYFLRGYFDGDGCINLEKKNKNRLNVIFTSGSKTFLVGLANRIKTDIADISSSISYGSGAFRLRYSFRNAFLVAKYIYRDIFSAPYLSYKFEKFTEYKKTRENFLLSNKSFAL